VRVGVDPLFDTALIALLADSALAGDVPAVPKNVREKQ
jgi:hypothetical protein